MSRLRDARPLALVLGIGAVLFADVLFLGNNFFLRDLTKYHYPMKRVVRDTLLAGEFPSWTRAFSGGQPMAANPAYEIFYPPQLLILLGDYNLGFRLHILFHIAVALAGMYALLRSLDLRTEVAVTGALSFGVGGFFLATTNVLPTCFVWAWAPLLALVLHRYVRDRKPRDLALAALLLGLLFTIGEPVSLMQLWFLIGVYALYDAVAERGRRLWRNGMSLLILVAGAIAVGAVQLLPALDHFRDSVRSHGLDVGHSVAFSIHPLRLFELFDPSLMTRLSGPRPDPYFVSLYCGLLVPVLVVAGVVARARGALLVASITIGAFLIALGDHLPIFPMLHRSGLLGWLRYPEKALAMLVFVFLVFAAIALDRFLSGDARMTRAAIAVAAIVALVTTAFAARTAVFALALTALLAWARGGRHAKYVAYALVAFVVADIGPLQRLVAPRIERKFFEPPEIVSLLDRDVDNYSIFHMADWLPSTGPVRYETMGPERMWVVRNGILPLTPPSWGLRLALHRDYDETMLLATRELTDAMRALNATGIRRWSEPFVAMSNVRYVLEFDDLARDLRRHGGDYSRSRPVRVVRVPDHPRYDFAQTIVEARDTRDVVRYLQTNPLVSKPGFVSIPPFTPAPARVSGVRETSNSASIDVEASGSALLVMSVTRHKYWRATIDGQPAELLPVNIAYQGLIVPAGTHRIEMQYRNPLITIGAVISLLAIGAAVWIVCKR